MPNYCYNTMSLAGNKKEIRKFINDITVKENEYDMNPLVPLGEEDAHDVWGSKWGAFDIEGDELNSNNPSFRYQSAWLPCNKLIQQISVQYPNVVFAVVSTEESHDFIISEIFHNGKSVERYQINPFSMMPPELEKMREEAEEDDGDWDDEDWEEYHDAESEFYNDLEGNAWQDCEDVVEQYIKYLAKVKRQKREGREIDDFIPE